MSVITSGRREYSHSDAPSYHHNPAKSKCPPNLAIIRALQFDNNLNVPELNHHHQLRTSQSAMNLLDRRSRTRSRANLHAAATGTENHQHQHRRQQQQRHEGNKKYYHTNNPNPGTPTSETRLRNSASYPELSRLADTRSSSNKPRRSRKTLNKELPPLPPSKASSQQQQQQENQIEGTTGRAKLVLINKEGSSSHRRRSHLMQSNSNPTAETSTAAIQPATSSEFLPKHTTTTITHSVPDVDDTYSPTTTTRAVLKARKLSLLTLTEVSIENKRVSSIQRKSVPLFIHTTESEIVDTMTTSRLDQHSTGAFARSTDSLDSPHLKRHTIQQDGTFEGDTIAAAASAFEFRYSPKDNTITASSTPLESSITSLKSQLAKSTHHHHHNHHHSSHHILPTSSTSLTEEHESTGEDPFAYQGDLVVPRTVSYRDNNLSAIDTDRANKYSSSQDSIMLNDEDNGEKQHEVLPMHLSNSASQSSERLQQSRDSAIAVTPALNEPKFDSDKTSTPSVSSAAHVSSNSHSSVLSNYKPEELQSQVHYTYGRLSDPEDQRRIKQKFNLIKEFYDTEIAFATDMGVLINVYFEQLKTEPFFGYVCKRDVASLASNVERILQLSRQFTGNLKDSIPLEILSGQFQGEELQDIATHIGDVVLDYVPIMESDFQWYCDRCPQQTATLNRIVKLASPVIELWLNECHERSKSMTTAPSLDALLIKPVQRVSRYKLLLDNINKETPVGHADKMKLEQGIAMISECLKRMDTNHGSTLDHASEISTSSSYGGGKGLTDEEANAILLDLQYKHTADVVLEDLLEEFEQRRKAALDLAKVVTKNTKLMQRHFDANNRLARSWYSWVMAMHGDEDYPAPKLDARQAAKMRRYKYYTVFSAASTSNSSSHASTKALAQQIDANVMRGFESVIAMFNSAGDLIEKRKRYHDAYSRYIKSKEQSRSRGLSPTKSSHAREIDATTKNEADHFVKFHNALKDGLPDLFFTTNQFINASMHQFVQIQRDWYRAAADSLAGVFNIKVSDIRDMSGATPKRDPVVEKYHRREQRDPRRAFVEDLSIIRNSHSAAAAAATAAAAAAAQTTSGGEFESDLEWASSANELHTRPRPVSDNVSLDSSSRLRPVASDNDDQSRFQFQKPPQVLRTAKSSASLLKPKSSKTKASGSGSESSSNRNSSFMASLHLQQRTSSKSGNKDDKNNLTTTTTHHADLASVEAHEHEHEQVKKSVSRKFWPGSKH